MAHVYRKLKLADDYPITASCKSDTPLNDEFVVRVSMLRVFHMIWGHVKNRGAVVIQICVFLLQCVRKSFNR